MYNEGISVAGDVLDTSLAFGIIDKSGNSYSYGETKLGVGRETVKTFLKKDKKLLAEIKKKVWKEFRSSEVE
jgi:recombination protein RecA